MQVRLVREAAGSAPTMGPAGKMPLLALKCVSIEHIKQLSQEDHIMAERAVMRELDLP